MSRQGVELAVEMPVAAEREVESSPPTGVAARAGLSWWAVARVVAVPAAALLALAVHRWAPDRTDRGLATYTQSYPTLLWVLVILGMAAAVGRQFWGGLRRFVDEKGPLVTAVILTVCAWEVVTLKLGLLPLVYFPAPESILMTLIDDRRALFESTWHSLFLLLSGYGLGVLAGLISGICIGWSSGVRYWGMPVLKIVGPIPATAWIPMALVMFPRSYMAGVSLIALAVWFPVTMLTASGVSNVRASFLDVARTLGAGRAYLIFRVAIPAAMPSIFIGLFMGCGASFLTLLVAESTGVSAGLGWYIDWARNYSDYNKVFAALVIMSAFFSTIMTVLFKVRDRVLVWQKGVIKW
jgi:NitT/TauT family transport system permease protein